MLSAQEKANGARTRAHEASVRVTEAYDLVTEVLHFLDQALELDMSQLDELEERLAQAYAQYAASNIDESTEELTQVTCRVSWH